MALFSLNNKMCLVFVILIASAPACSDSSSDDTNSMENSVLTAEEARKALMDLCEGHLDNPLFKHGLRYLQTKEIVFEDANSIRIGPWYCHLENKVFGVHFGKPGKDFTHSASGVFFVKKGRWVAKKTAESIS